MATSVSLDFSGALDLHCENAGKVFEQVRREFITEMSAKLETVVRDNIVSSDINDSHNKLRSWQNASVGSRGGYVAVRPISAGGGKNSPAAITGYNERGHRVRMPSGNAERYVPKVKKFKTTAYGFYADSKVPAQRLLDEAGQKVAEAVAKALEDL